MITRNQCKKNLRVKWKSLDDTIPASLGTIVEIGRDRFMVLWDDQDADIQSFEMDDAASRIFLLRIC